MKNSERKAPEINRGYFARVQGVRILLQQFLQVHKFIAYSNNFHMQFPMVSQCYYISLLYSPFSDRVGLPLHNIPSSGVLMKSIGADFFTTECPS